ncbi:hypothetical protein ACFV9D_37715 [Streptomyces sp. NPDC059875]|uniref:hypothetical protein n=1 Tax=unclassified Streptomyces TaxID=2593676 RepID=UPI00366A1CFF
MAEAVDGGGGAIGALSSMSMFGGVVGAAAAAASLAVEVSELANLKSRVDQLLKDFQESHAGPGKIGADWLDKGALAGPGFMEAEYLFSSYDVVREELLKFSKVLGLQMESMKIAIDFSKTGYENIDDDIRARMKSLNTQITDLQKREADDPANSHTMGGTSQAHVPQTSAPADGGDNGSQGGL